jgi:membrane protease YdiL (CAAX protease family)
MPSTGRIMTLNEQLIALLVIAAISASTAVWAAAIARLRRGEEILPLEPRRPVPWAFVDLLLVLMVHFLLSGLGLFLLRDVWRIDVPQDIRAIGDHLIPLQIVYIAERLATLVFAIMLVCMRAKATAVDLGMSLDRWRYDLRIGLLGFVALAPPVYALQAILVHFFPTQHPLIDVLLERPESLAVILVSFSVAVVAPVSEEFFLRVFLQGWLERVVAIAAPGAFPTLANKDAEDLPLAESSTTAGDEARSENPYAAPQAPRAAAGERDPGIRAARAIPIVTSSLVFALLHVGHGPAPLPLFCLALGLGYLYQRTHRLWPCVVVHCLLNTSSLAMLWLQQA